MSGVAMYWYYKGMMALVTIHGVLIIIYRLPSISYTSETTTILYDGYHLPPQNYSMTHLEKGVLGYANHTHVIIISGFRSGSSLFGDILNRDDEVFFAYEPLHDMDDMLVNEMTSNEAAEFVTQVSERVLGCEFTRLSEDHFNHLATKRFLGNRKLECEDGSGEGSLCFDVGHISKRCQELPIHVIKYVRVTLDQVAHLMDKYSNVKVIWMYRDPRAVWNRRIRYDWCHPVMCRNPSIMCDDSNKNLVLSKHLLLTNPEQFTTLKFEDITRNPQMEFLRVVRFINMKPNQVLETVGKEYFTPETNGWQENLPYLEREMIEQKCASSIAGLGYE